MHTHLDEAEQRVLVLLANQTVHRTGIDGTVPRVPDKVLRDLVAKGLVTSGSVSDDFLVTLTGEGQAAAKSLRDGGVVAWPIGANETRTYLDGALDVVVIRDPGDDSWHLKDLLYTLPPFPNRASIRMPESLWERTFPSAEQAFQEFERELENVIRSG